MAAWKFLVLASTVLLGVQSADRKYRKMFVVTDTTPFTALPKSMKGLVTSMVEAHKSLEAVQGQGFKSRLDRCRFRYEIDSNVLLYLLKRWSTKTITIHAQSRDVVAHLARNWYLIHTTRIFYLFNCLFRPAKLLPNTFMMLEGPKEGPKEAPKA